MKKTIIISIIVGILALAGGFAGGWYANNKSEQKEQNKVSTLGNEFMFKLFSQKNDQAYKMTSDNYQKINTQEEFNKQVVILNDRNLEPGITSIYKNGASYMITQEYIDKDGKTTKVAVLNITKFGKEFKITNVSAN